MVGGKDVAIVSQWRRVTTTKQPTERFRPVDRAGRIELLGRIPDVGLTISRPGYKTDEVDRVLRNLKPLGQELERLVQSVDREQSMAPGGLPPHKIALLRQLPHIQFSQVRKGYSPAEVDQLMSDLGPLADDFAELAPRER